MKRYVVVYITDGCAVPNVYFFNSTLEKINYYFRNRIGETIILWDDFEISDPLDSAGNKIPKSAIKFLNELGISELEANESITIKEIPE